MSSVDFWNQRYGQGDHAYGTEPNDFVREVVDRLPAGPVLCLAAGEGRNAVFLAGLDRFGPVTAMDYSDVGLAVTRELAAERGVQVHTEVGDLADYDFAGPWAVITAIWAHCPPPVRTRMLTEASAALRPGGALVIEAYTPAQVGRGTGGPPVVEVMWSLDQLRRDLPDLDFVIAREVEREVHEGRHHHGLSATVQVLAVKPGAPPES